MWACSAASGGALAGRACCASGAGGRCRSSMMAMRRVPRACRRPGRASRNTSMRCSPTGSCFEIHVQPPTGVGVTQLRVWACSTSCRPLFTGVLPRTCRCGTHHPRRWRARRAGCARPACNGQAAVGERVDVLGVALQWLARDVARWHGTLANVA